MNALNVIGSIASTISLMMAIYFELASDEAAKRNIALLVAFAFIVIVVVRLVRYRRTVLQDEVELALDLHRTHGYFYPHGFRRPPNLKIETIEGSAEIEIIEQRADGFQIKIVGSEAWGSPKLKIRWIAKGEPS